MKRMILMQRVTVYILLGYRIEVLRAASFVEPVHCLGYNIRFVV
jgi:hypothetical protein